MRPLYVRSQVVCLLERGVHIAGWKSCDVRKQMHHRALSGPKPSCQELVRSFQPGREGSRTWIARMTLNRCANDGLVGPRLQLGSLGSLMLRSFWSSIDRIGSQSKKSFV